MYRDGNWELSGWRGLLILAAWQNSFETNPSQREFYFNLLKVTNFELINFAPFLCIFVTIIENKLRFNNPEIKIINSK